MYDYLVVGSGLYGAVFAHEAKAKGKSVLVIDKRPNIAGNVYTEKLEGINFHKYGAHISIQTIPRYGITLHSLLISTDSQIHRLQIIKVSFIQCLLICTHLIKCGVL